MADVNANIGVNIDTSEALAQLKALQRQISQFHTSIAKSSESAALAQRDLQKNFLNSVNAIGAFSAELRTVRTTAESFTNSLEKNKFSMREYFRFAGGSTKTFGKLFKSEFDTIGKVAEDRVKRLQTQYIKLGRDTSGAMKAIAIMPNQLDMSNFSTQSQIAAQKQAIFNQLVKQGSTNLLNFGKNTQWAGRQLMVGFTLPLAALGTVATRTFMDMEEATIKFRKVYGDLFTPKAETDAALESITALGQMFTQYGVAVSQTVGLAAEAAAAGFQGVDLQRQTAQATRLSVLGQIEANKALETTISLQNAFKMSSDQLAGSIDFLNAVENQTVVSLDDITTAIPKVAPVIQQLGGDVKDLAFFMAAMKEGGINASEGANALKSGLAALINPTEKASAILQGYGINIKKIVEGNQGDLKATVVEFAQALDTLDPLTRARAIEQLFGKFQFARLSTLFDNVTNQTGQAARVLDLAGTSVEDLAALSETELGVTADSAMNKFRKSVEDLKLALVPVGQTFLQAVTPIVEFAGSILEKFNNLSSGVKKAIVVLTVAIGAIGPVALMTFGLLANGIANIVKGAMILRNGYLRLTGQSQILGEQTEYLTMEQIDAAAASHSLDQSHARLTQTFTAETGAIGQLIAAYQQGTTAAAKFAAINPGMMRAPNVIPTKRAKGKPVVVGGTGNKDTELALLTPGETVIPAEMSKRYGALINGMIAGNIPGYRRGLGTGDSEFAQSVAAGASTLKSQAKVQQFLEKELQAIPETLVEEFKSLVRTVAQEINLSETALKERLREFRSQYVANIGQQERPQFSHIGAGRKMSAGELRESGAVTNPKTQERLDYFIEKVGSDVAVDLKTGFGANFTGVLNNAMKDVGANLQTTIQDSVVSGSEKWRKSIEIGGGSFESLGDDLVRFDTEFNRNLQSAYDNGARIIVDSQTQIEEMRMQAIAKNEEFDDTVYVALDTITEQTRQNVLQLGSGLDAVFEEALQTITEIRYTGLTPQQTEALGAKFAGRANANYGRITPGATSTLRKVGGAGSFRDLPPLAEQSVANVNGAIAATAQAAGTQSPSKKTIPIGEDIARGLQVGMANQQDEVAASGQALGAAAVSGTQSGGVRQRRIATRPAGPPNVSSQSESLLNQETTARKTSVQRLDSMNKALMGGTFALTSLAGAGSMAGGTIGKLSNQVMKYSGLLFGLMSITQLLTQTKMAELIATRLQIARGAMVTAKEVGPSVAGIAGRSGLLGTLGRVVMGLKVFLGPIGLVTTALFATYSIIKLSNKEREKERQRLEAFSDVLSTTSAQLNFLKDQFNFIPIKGSLEQFGKDLERVSAKTRTEREQIKESPGFQEGYGQIIGQVRDMTAEQAKSALTFKGLELISQGMAKEQVQALIDAIKEEAGQKDLKFDFKSISFDKAGITNLTSELGTSLDGFQKTFQSGLQKVYEQVAVGEGRSARINLVERLIPNKEAKAALKNASSAVASYSLSLNRLVQSGSMDMKQFKQATDAMFSQIQKSVPDANTQLRLFNRILREISPALADSAKGVSNLKDKQLLLRAAIAGVSDSLIVNAATAIATAEALNKVADANLKAFGVKSISADQAKALNEADIASNAAKKDLNKRIEEEIALAKKRNEVTKETITTTESAAEKLKKKADELFGFLERAAQREYKPKIINAEKEIKNAEDAVDKIQDRIDAIQSDIDVQQRDLETQISRKIEDYQEQVNDLQRTIEMEFDRPIEEIQKEISALERGIELDFNRPLEALQETSSDLSNELTLLDRAADAINQKYDAQEEALNKVADANQKLIDQDKQRLSLADALTQGDISAAAAAIQDMRKSSAAAAAGSRSDLLKEQRQAELDKQRTASGLTRKQIEEAQFIISQKIFAIEEKREAVQAIIQTKQDAIFEIEKSREATLTKIKGIEDDIYDLQEEREAKLIDIRDLEDDIYNIRIKELDPATKSLEKAKSKLQALQDELQARLDSVDLQRDAFEAEADAAIAREVAQGKYNDVLTKTLGLLQQIASLNGQIEKGAAGYNAKLPKITDEDEALDDFIAKAAKVDDLTARIEDAVENGEWYRLANLNAQLADAQAAYDATLPAIDTNFVGGGGGLNFQTLSSGGMVKPKYFSVGGQARGTDIVPAMLTPGEFVMSKYAVSSYGTDKMKAINSGTYEGEKVYNYNLSVNVKSDSNPDDIARVVIKQIQQLDNQRIRKQAN